MTHVTLTRFSTIDRDSEDRYVAIPGIGFNFTELMIEVRKVVPDRRFKFYESWETN